MSTNLHAKIFFMIFGLLMGSIGVYDIRLRHRIKEKGVWVRATLHAVKRSTHIFGLGRPSYWPVFRFTYRGQTVYSNGYTAFRKNPESIEQLNKEEWRVGFVHSGVKKPKSVHYTGPLKMRGLYTGPLVLLALCILIIIYL